MADSVNEKMVVVSVKVPPALKERLRAVCAAHPTAGGTPSDAGDLLRAAVERVVAEAEGKTARRAREENAPEGEAPAAQARTRARRQ